MPARLSARGRRGWMSASELRIRSTPTGPLLLRSSASERGGDIGGVYRRHRRPPGLTISSRSTGPAHPLRWNFLPRLSSTTLLSATTFSRIVLDVELSTPTQPGDLADLDDVHGVFPTANLVESKETSGGPWNVDGATGAF
jgi:hypothetical protein